MSNLLHSASKRCAEVGLIKFSDSVECGIRKRGIGQLEADIFDRVKHELRRVKTRRSWWMEDVEIDNHGL